VFAAAVAEPVLASRYLGTQREDSSLKPQRRTRKVPHRRLRSNNA